MVDTVLSTSAVSSHSILTTLKEGSVVVLLPLQGGNLWIREFKGRVQGPTELALEIKQPAS